MAEFVIRNLINIQIKDSATKPHHETKAMSAHAYGERYEQMAEEATLAGEAVVWGW